tara:strand:+ start:612 stop:944 length:333 start_codon:yes stop_codon:yes gene_type:complete
MLSTQYRLRLEGICSKIVNGEAVELGDMIWAEKLAAHNASAAKILRQARRKASNPDMTEDNLDGFLNALDLGDPDPTRHKTGFNSVDEIVDFFKRDDVDEDGDRNWRRRD